MHVQSRPAPAAGESRWIVCPRRNPSASLRLLCFASAGHGPAMFRSWMPLVSSPIELCIAQLPGRESRWSEKPALALSELLPGLVDAVRPLLDRPLALFGHSLGALIAFELARALRSATGRQPQRLFASAHRAPQRPNRHPRISRLPDDEFVRAVDARHGGVPPDVAANRELMELMLPSLKADYRVFEDYEYVPAAPLDCPITAFGGTRDEYVGEQDLEPWREQTAAAFSLRMIEGGHFFVNEVRPQVVAAVQEDLLQAAT